MSTATPSFQRNTRWVIWAIGLFVGLKLIYGIYGGLTGAGDFEGRYVSTRSILEGVDPYRVDLDAERTPSQIRRGADYLPSALLPMLVLTFLPLQAARFVWLLISLACAGVLLRQSLALEPLRTSRIAGLGATGLAISLWLSGSAFSNHLQLGQNCLFSLAFGLAAVKAARKQHHYWGGFLLALALFKYAYIWPVLMVVYLDRAWKTLVFAGIIHLVVHLALCHWMSVGPIDVLGEVLQLNSRIFRRNETLTFWLPWRFFSSFVPVGSTAANILGAVTFLLFTALAGFAWRRDQTHGNDAGWILVFGNLSTLAVASKGYQLVYFLPGWLWCFRWWHSPETRSLSRWVAVSMFAISIGIPFVRRAEIWASETGDAPVALGLLNIALASLCVTSAQLLRTAIRIQSTAIPAGSASGIIPKPSPSGQVSTGDADSGALSCPATDP